VIINFSLPLSLLSLSIFAIILHLSFLYAELNSQKLLTVSKMRLLLQTHARSILLCSDNVTYKVTYSVFLLYFIFVLYLIIGYFICLVCLLLMANKLHHYRVSDQSHLVSDSVLVLSSAELWKYAGLLL